jgi:trimeric autotransporter adhesin
VADDGDFRIAGAYTEIYLKDTTDADWQKIKAKLEKDKGVTIKVGLDQASAKQTGVDLRATAKAMGDESPVSLKVEVDKASLAKASEEIKAANAKAASANTGSVGSGSSSGGLSPLIAGGGILAGAAGSAALLGGIAAGISAIGIAAEAENKDVKASFTDLTASAKQTAQEGFAPLVPAITGFASQAKTAVDGLAPKFRQAAETITPQLDLIGTGLVSSVTHGVDDITPVLGRLDPLATSVGRSFGTMEQGVSQALDGIDATKAASSVDTLSGAAKNVIAPLGGVLNAAEPLASGLVNVLGRAAGTTEQELSELTPATNLLGAGLNALSPVVGFVAPPLLAVGVASKVLTGSWTDLSGAGRKLISPFTDMTATSTALANKIGFTTTAQNAATKADLEAAAQKALLNKELAEEAVADAVLSEAQGNATRAALELAAAEDALTAASAEATVAEEAAAAAAEGLTFSLGPIGLVLGVVAAAAGAFALKGDDAKQSAQDLSQQIVQLGMDTPQAAASMAGSSADIQKVSTALGAVGSSAVQFSQAYSGSLTQASRYTTGLVNAQQTLGDMMVTVAGKSSGAGKAAGEAAESQSVSIKALSESVGNSKSAFDALSPALQHQVALYDAYNDIVPQAQHALEDMRAAQAAQAAALAQEGVALSASQTAWSAYGNGVAKTVSDFNTATSGIKSLTDATVNANSTFFQDQASFAQLDDAVTQAAQAKSQAAAGIASADNGIKQASQGVASALHSEQQATEAVGTARTGVVTAQRAVTAAQTSYTQSLAAERTAQAALSAARKQAVVDLQNLQRQVTDQGDTEAEAQVRLLDATNAVINAGLSGKTLASLGPVTTGNEANFQLLLAEQEAQHNLNDTTIQSQQLAAQNAAQQKAGVAGAAGVVSATQAVTQAQQQDKTAAQSLADSKSAVLKSSAAVKEAQYEEGQAHLATENAQYAEKQASDQLTAAKAASRTATAALQGAKDADSRSTDINTAAGAANFTKVEDLFEANLSATGSVSAATTATINQGHSMHITAGNVKEVIDRVTGLDGETARFGVIGMPSVDMSSLINAAVKQGLDPAQLGFKSAQIGNARASGTGIFPTHADGGPIGGVGTGRSDSNLIWASKGEHMWTADEVRAAGGHSAVKALRDSVKGYAGGGAIGGDGASIIGANIELAEVGGMVQAARDAFTGLGIKTSALPSLPVKNPPAPAFNISGSDSGLRGSRAANEAVVQRIWSSMFGWTGNEWAATVPLIMQESGFNNTAQNQTSTAYGMFQFLDSTWSGYGIPKTSDPTQQSIAGGRYIGARYHDPIGALAHERAYNWYDGGGYMLGNPGINLTKKPEMVLDPGMTNTLDTINTAVQSGGRTSTPGRSVNITNYITQQPREDGSALASRVSAENAWNLMTMVGG